MKASKTIAFALIATFSLGNADAQFWSHHQMTHKQIKKEHKKWEKVQKKKEKEHKKDHHHK